MLNRPSKAAIVPVGLITALLAALAVSLLFLLPGGPLRAQSADQFFTYVENSTDPVATFTASDPEDATPAYWSILPADATFTGIEGVDTTDAADAGLFKIDQSGVLSFKTPRSYEDNSDSDDGGKEYRVTVQVSDGSEIEYFKAYVTVTDMEEPGKVTWIVGPDGTEPDDTDIRLQQFQPGAQLLASVTDPDGDPSSATYKWYRGSMAISGQTSVAYTVVSDDVGNHIRVEATYSDGRGPAETVSFTSENPVQEYRRSTDNTVPAFTSTAVTRRVEENSTGNVGGPVTATDANSDKLTYTLGDAGDNDPFKIDIATGQLMVDGTINYENVDGYTVTVTATDSSGEVTATPATVTINVIDVDEKPTFATDSDTNGVLNAGGVLAAQTEGRTVIDTDDDPADANATEAAILEASDPDGKKVTLSLMGDDAGAFELADDGDAGNAVSQVLSFKEKTDYEMPGDRNRDNVYEVTVRASDGTMNADRSLIIKVINDAMEGGKVTVTPEDAVVGVELTATLTHMEGGVSASGQIANEMWQWQRAAVPDAPNTCADVDGETGWADIPGAKKTAYTPVPDDRDGDATIPGGCLSAMVTYKYRFATTDSLARSDGTAVLASQANQAPKFKEGTSTFRVVAENVAANAGDDTTADSTEVDTNDNVGSRIEATDANGDTPTYSLSGSGASLFRVRSNGQIEVKGELDHDKSGGSSHTMTLTANDGSDTSNDSARITVTIYVTDVDEAPTIKDRADSTAKGMRTVDYKENSTGPVARFTASDPEGATPGYWSKTDVEVTDVVAAPDRADRALFKIDQSGVLSFEKPRSYEDNSDSGDKEYRVTVQVSDGTNNGYFKLTVSVTDVEETGKITWTVSPRDAPISGLQQFQPGAELAPTVTDPDSVTTDDSRGAVLNADVTEWKWYRGSTVISGETEATYSVGADDVGKRIRVEATYTDANDGPAETVRFTSENPVQSAAQPETNDAPEFASTAVTRRVEENSTGNVGGPVTATDANSDKLTYTLGDAGDNDPFKIDIATGQLMVDGTINYENVDGYTVTVTVTDSSGEVTATPATVTINVIDVDEKPTFATDSDTNGVLNAGGVLAAQTEGRTVIDTDDDPADANATEAAILEASDPDGKKVTLSLMGDDAGAFELADDGDAGNAVSQVLSFKEKTDYEMPGDRNRDNVYEVTVRASDGTMNADRSLIIKVINDPNEGGKVTVTPEDAVVGVELTATLTHMEGGVSASGQIANEMWLWQMATINGGETCAADASDEDYSAISNATKAAYTPVSDDAGDCLRAMVTYNYQFAAGTTTVSSAGTEVLVSPTNQAPKFKEGTSTFRVVAEGLAANAGDDSTGDGATGEPATNDNVGSPIVATDANGDTLTYSLGGAGASLFRVRSDGQIASDGQIEVKGKLDHEKSSSHTVTLTANDGSGTSNDSATITVTIYVTDVDEKPTIRASGAIVISGPSAASQAEGVGGEVARYSVSGAGGETVAWRLTGSDASRFSISQSGVVSFKSTPDYESKSSYTFTVNATVNGESATPLNVTVSVTNVEEPGTVTLSTDRPRAGARITATLKDPDTFTASDVNWQWESSADGMGSWTAITGAMDASYMVVETDSDKYLRATAMYTDGEGSGKSAESAATGSAVTGNTAPMFAAETADRSVAENTAAGGNIGAVVVATDVDAGDSLTYTLGGADGASFTIVANTGQLQVKDALDFETRTSYEVEVTATDGSGASAMITVTITVTDRAIEGAASDYDADNNGTIESAEVLAAVGDYFDGDLTVQEVLAVVAVYFESA